MPPQVRFPGPPAYSPLREIVTSLTSAAPPNRIAQYWALTKPRVTQLAVFCAVIGMFLSTPGLPDWRVVVAATVGIWLLAGAAFAVNCLVEREIDSRMARTARRPMARGEITVPQTLIFSGVIGGAGMWILFAFVNPLTMWLTFATFVGYAIIYTIILKPATPQNIVIGGLAGAMPPALGWAAIANDVPMQAWILVLIIFIWTPPHFWALALVKSSEYGRAGIPMMPNVKGPARTRLEIVLYTLLLAPLGVAPYFMGFASDVYGIVATLAGSVMLVCALRVYVVREGEAANKAAMQLFGVSILYLFLLFAVIVAENGLAALR
jgi:protoheme IX farnesyltransferase